VVEKIVENIVEVLIILLEELILVSSRVESFLVFRFADAFPCFFTVHPVVRF
jgi:hypothetical protein